MIKSCLNCDRKVNCTLPLAICKLEHWIEDQTLAYLKMIDKNK